MKKDLEKIVNLCKQYGFVYQGSEVYGGLANTWDMGPLGVELQNNIKNLWWKTFVQREKNVSGVDAAIFMNPKVWEASGHIGGFKDPLMDCKKCKTRHRADKLIEDFTFEKGEQVDADGWSDEKLMNYILENKIVCPKCGALDYTEIRKFSLMFDTKRGVIEGDNSTIYLRPETAQGEFVNFLNVQRSMRYKLPFGIGQIGKSFRNEITPGNFIFRTIEFEQMELQYFVKPGEEMDAFEKYKQKQKDFYTMLGAKEDDLRFADHSEDKLAFYANAATDVEYKFPFGWGELCGTHSRTDYDLTQHQKFSGKSMEYLDPVTNEKYIPYVVEASMGVYRAFLVALFAAYDVEKLENEEREVLRLPASIAPYKAAILPLAKKYHSEKANEVFDMLSEHFMISYDETGSIGKRYRRQDVIGTPFCITVTDETINDNTVTIRFRDNMEQITISLDEVKDYIEERIKF